MKTYTKKRLDKILNLHKKWLAGDPDGVKADLSKANLYGIDLHEANLIKANLIGANLSRANLWGANLWGSNLIGANLKGANLIGANLTYTYIKSFTLGKNFGYMWIDDKDKKIVSIGCESHTLDYWLDNYKKIGERYKYSKDEIYNYGLQLKLLKKAV